MTIRVIRLMEYTYETVADAYRDMAHWTVPAQGMMNPSGRPDRAIKSAVILDPFGQSVSELHFMPGEEPDGNTG